LWIRVYNSHKEDTPFFEAAALIDTGADDCVFPAKVANSIGHILKRAIPKPMKTAGGSTVAYPHRCKIEVMDILANGRAGNKVLYTIEDTPIDFSELCEPFLLGVKSFLGKFILNIDYPKQVFSLRNPKP